MTSPPSPSPRPPLVAHPGRVLTVVCTLGVVVTLLIWGFSSAETETGLTRNAPVFPSEIETLSPGPGELTGRQSTLAIDLRNDLTGVVLVQPPNGPAFEIPEDQLDRVEPLGQLSWRPGPNQELERFAPGTYTLTVYYWPQTKPRPESPPGYTWSFRATA